MSRIVMILSNPFRPDPRVDQEAKTLSARGHQVTIVCWDREGILPTQESREGIRIVRVQSVKAGFGTGWRLAVRISRFWRQAVRLAIDVQPEVVHCHDLDTLYPGWRIKKRLGCRLIYDAHEHYPAMVSLSLPAPFVRALTLWERWLTRRVDATITASTVLRDEFAGPRPVARGHDRVLSRHRAVRCRHGNRAERPADATSRGARRPAGGLHRRFSPNRMLLPMIEAADLLPQVRFHLWGDGAQRAAVEQAAAGRPNVSYHGWLPSSELPRHFKAADVIFYGLRLDYPGAIYNAPNTLSYAMTAGHPVVATNLGDLGRSVRQSECGS